MTDYQPILAVFGWDDVILIVVMMALSYGIMALTAKSPKGMNATPESEFDMPTAEEGKPIAVLFGTKRLKDPNVVWYGDITTQAIKK